ncbi:MAG: hypothetical protein F4Y03_11840 [Alphaproteobacteria bacterium]|nr:hypothetical protein [Alphaproteobacteria bacterium]
MTGADGGSNLPKRQPAARSPQEANWDDRTLFIADNIHVLRGMNSESVDCIATDPPFNAKRLFNAPLGSKAAGQRFDDRWRWDEVTDEWQDLIATDHPAIKEIIEAAAVIEGGKVDHRTGKITTGRRQNSIAAYLAYMAPRIVEMRRVLKPTGVLFMQCNWEADSYLRLLLDAVFGRDKLINEIAWKSHPAKGHASRRLPRNHGTIFAYGKTMRWKWNPPYEPYDLQRLQRKYTDDEFAQLSEADQKTLTDYDQFDGARRYGLGDLTNPNKNRPNLTYEFLGFTKVWRWEPDRMNAAYEAGIVVQTKPGNVPRRKKYLDEQRGRPRDDVWLDVVLPESSDSEWTTRKPIALYQRLIECATDPGDMVLDPFAGCATTCVAAEYLNPRRQWTAIDIDPVAERETESRLKEAAGLFGAAVAPVRTRKTRLRRRDIPFIPDAKLRQALWARQGRKCANPYCDSEALRAADMELDHRIPHIRGGDDDALNRIALCGNCNRRKGKKAWGLFLDEERAKLPHEVRGGKP